MIKLAHYPLRVVGAIALLVALIIMGQSPWAAMQVLGTAAVLIMILVVVIGIIVERPKNAKAAAEALRIDKER
jgi:hypothetical protein